MSVSRARVARRIAAAAAYGGGGAGLLGGAAVGLLLAEMRWARRLVGVPDGEPPRADGCYGASFALLSDREPLRLGFLGDSTAAGQGVHRARETPGALLASGLAAVAERPVLLRNVALSGAMSGDLDRQVSLLLADRTQVPHTCVIMIGANDVTNRVPAAQSVRLLSDAVRRLREAGCQVVVGTCPDLGTIEPVYQPLRWVARRLSRQLAAAQTIGVVEQGGRTVSLGSLLGPEFEANPRELFGPDNYHPSAEGYATAAMAVLPTLCAALGLWPEERLDVSRAEGILPVAQAAARAASEGGTEVAAAGGTAAGAGPARGPWALLKHRRRRQLPKDDAPAADGGRQPGREPEGEPEREPEHGTERTPERGPGRAPDRKPGRGPERSSGRATGRVAG
ncbi:SGNH/GDSL hydrolase family protein [Streptomyces xinghaiensis]|uniref:SGNH/GDSL hydrolase family protein n=1 Tax=Streptomyces xinghaiensis TaxID=1038928 RepID=UPI000BB0C544|nr:SGNH/GDSL hydrolase family protein [Streptomyces xinghaiensis]